MKLSLCTITVNSAAYIEQLLRAGRELADEIVVAVDGMSTDSTEDICGKYCDKLFLTEPLGDFSKAVVWLNEQCSGDWILRLDQDELPSEKLVENLPLLMRDRDITHYHLRRRWIFGEERERWISQFPWWPDWQLRLYRNIPSIMRYPGRIHTSFDIQGASRHVYEGSIYHLDFVYHSKEQRQRKVELYERLSPENRLGHFFLLDEASLVTKLLPRDDLPLRPPACSTGRGGRLRGIFERRPIWRRPTARTPARRVTLSDLRRSSSREVEYDAGLFRARLSCTDCPRAMLAGGWQPVDVELRNDSNVAWSLPGQGVPRVRVGYHWLRTDSEMHLYEGHRTDLPRTLRPGEKIRLPASVLAPEEPGDYVLEWDLVIENVAWFSARGWQGPRTTVRVSS